MTIDRLWLAAGAFFGLSGAALGAFGAHALRGIVDPESLGPFETGVRYQMYHALGLALLAALGARVSEGPAQWTGWLFTAGIVIFSGSLYLLALTGARWLGAIT